MELWTGWRPRVGGGSKRYIREPFSHEIMMIWIVVYLSSLHSRLQPDPQSNNIVSCSGLKASKTLALLPLPKKLLPYTQHIHETDSKSIAHKLHTWPRYFTLNPRYTYCIARRGFSRNKTDSSARPPQPHKNILFHVSFLASFFAPKTFACAASSVRGGECEEKKLNSPAKAFAF